MRSMFTRVFATLFLAFCAVTGFAGELPASKTKNVTLPEGTMITEPGSDVEPWLAAFVGVWEGEWMSTVGAAPAALVVQSISVKEIKAIYLILINGQTKVIPASLTVRGPTLAFTTPTGSYLTFRIMAEGRMKVTRAMSNGSGDTEFYKVVSPQ
jgi:hypothetical protein